MMSEEDELLLQVISEYHRSEPLMECDAAVLARAILELRKSLEATEKWIEQKHGSGD